MCCLLALEAGSQDQGVAGLAALRALCVCVGGGRSRPTDFDAVSSRVFATSSSVHLSVSLYMDTCAAGLRAILVTSVFQN